MVARRDAPAHCSRRRSGARAGRASRWGRGRPPRAWSRRMAARRDAQFGRLRSNARHRGADRARRSSPSLRFSPASSASSWSCSSRSCSQRASGRSSPTCAAGRFPRPSASSSCTSRLLACMALMVLLLVQPIVSEASVTRTPISRRTRRTSSTGSPGSRGSFTSTSTSASRSGSVVDATQKVLIAIGGTIFSLIVNFVLVLVVGFSGW